MATRDLMNDIHTVVALAPVVASDNTVLTTAAIDTAGFESVTFVVLAGTLADADATFAVEVQEGSTSTQSAHTAVADIDLIGTEALAGFTFGDDGETRKIGYKGSAQYVSLEITPSGNSGNAPLAVLAILGHPHTRPTDNPPQ